MKKILCFLSLLVTPFGFAEEAPFAKKKEKPVPEMKIKALADGVYLHTSYKFFNGFGMVGSNGVVYFDGKKAFIIDTPATEEDTAKLVAWVQSQGAEVKGSISTHFHDDSAAGIDWLNKHNIPTYVSSLTNELLKAKGAAQATNEMQGDSVWLKPEQLEVFYMGAGHSVDNSVVWLPKQQVLFGGCFVRNSFSKSMGNTEDASLSQWPVSANTLKSRYANAKVVVPGHGPTGSVDLLEHTRALATKFKKPR